MIGPAGPGGSSKGAAPGLPLARALRGDRSQVVNSLHPGRAWGLGLRGEPEASPVERLIAPYIDSKLSMRLLGNNLWLARLKRRAAERRRLGERDIEGLLLESVRVSHSEGRPVYAVLIRDSRELRVLALSDRVALALLEGGRGVAGREALEAARGLVGQATLYVLRDVPS
jgi:hypothetical protein